MRNDWMYETCDQCTREQRIAWHVSDELWNSVVIPYYRNRILCLECFLRMADDKGVIIEKEDVCIEGYIQRAYETVSLTKAKEIALRILEEAEKERLQIAEEEAQRGINWEESS